MFSENGRISEKQVGRTLVLPVFASCIFVLPYMAARLFERNIVWGLGVFLILAGIYSGIIYGLGRTIVPSQETTADLTQSSGMKWVGVIHVLRLCLRLAFYILLAVTILGEGQVPYMKEGGADRISNLLVVLPLLLVALYGANHSMEKVVRIHEMVFWVTFVPFLVMLAFGFREINWKIWIPQDTMLNGSLIVRGYLLVTCVLPVENYLQLKKAHNRKNAATRSYLGLLVTLLIVGFLSMIIVGIYGICGSAGEEMVTISIMRYIRMPFGVLERFDMLMIWFFMTGCFVLICNTLFFLGNRYREAFGERGVIWVMLGALALALVIVYQFPKYEVSVMWFLWYGAFVDVPLSIVLAVVEQGIRRRSCKKQGRKQRQKAARKGLCLTEKICMWIFAGCLVCVVLTGCGSDMRNVEQRDYATMLVIGQGKEEPYHIYLGIAKEHRVGEQSQVEKVLDYEVANLTQLKEQYGRQRGKELSLVHVKAIVCDEQVLAKREEGTALLYEMDENEELAKTCPVLLSEDIRSLVDYADKAEAPVGTYVSNLIQNFDTRGKRVPWLKDYLLYMREGEPFAPCVLLPGNQGFQIGLIKTRYQMPYTE